MFNLKKLTKYIRERVGFNLYMVWFFVIQPFFFFLKCFIYKFTIRLHYLLLAILYTCKISLSLLMKFRILWFCIIFFWKDTLLVELLFHDIHGDISVHLFGGRGGGGENQNTLIKRITPGKHRRSMSNLIHYILNL